MSALRSGGLIAFRTDTLYGVSADARSPAGMERLRKLKAGAGDRPFLSLAASGEATLEWCARVPMRCREMAAELWPGPFTLVFEAGPRVPPGLVAADGSWAVRVPANYWCRELAARVGGYLPSSSANLPGSPPAASPGEVALQLSAFLDLLVDAGPVPASMQASSLLDARDWPPRLLRGDSPRLAAYLDPGKAGGSAP